MAATKFDITINNNKITCKPDKIFKFHDPNDVFSCEVKNVDLYKKCKEALKDPWINVNIAINKFLSQGFEAWSVWSFIKKYCF